ncbi:unnamed protein product [Ceutorhynchus assimilis]|uniref:TIL domain-containing protein n=1 Tax=Ceutorhynchus assimilis TaxID=467358 RepID=A0A9P0DMW7_9CUCU|nr:unnamed protein product [Ceutorhynchus assimilis]
MNKLFVLFLMAQHLFIVTVLAQTAPPCDCECTGVRACRDINDCINKCDSEVCTDQAINGCYCKEGYCANKHNVCVPIEDD